MINTIDNYTYYKRHKPVKRIYVENFVKNYINNINIVYDVGCNNGEMSYFLQKEYNKNVFGIDLSNDLKIPDDYNFKNMDIIKDNSVHFNDMTIFFSLYHHILGKYGLKTADDIFYKLLLRTKYLLFDSGNVSELNRSDTTWYKKQQNIFKNEKELLDHFNIKYDVLGSWTCGGGKRSVVVFYTNDFNNKYEIVAEYKRYIGSIKQKNGLVNIDFIENTKDIFNDTIFKKIKFNDKYFFIKKHLNDGSETKELNNIINVYNNISKEYLINFYGYLKNVGFIYEWINNFKYIKKTKLKVTNSLTLNDVDLIYINNQKKYIDFHW